MARFKVTQEIRIVKTAEVDDENLGRVSGRIEQLMDPDETVVSMDITTHTELIGG